ncbi:hypothetical protein [Yeosuana marina]|jgi:hypothetical protein
MYNVDQIVDQNKDTKCKSLIYLSLPTHYPAEEITSAVESVGYHFTKK